MKSDQSKTLFLVWKANLTGEHIPIGRLDWEGHETVFFFLSGALKAKVKGMGVIPEFPDRDRVYRQNSLFPFFQNRLLDRKRPDFDDYIRSLGLDSHDSRLQDIEVLERSEGRKVTDRFRIFRKPQNVAGRFILHCFVSGMTRSPILEHLDEMLATLNEGDQLLPMLDIQNPHDRRAIGLKKDNGWTVGFVPAYYSPELQPLLHSDPDSVRFQVVRVNRPWKGWLPDVVLMRVDGLWPKDWTPFSEGLYSPLQEVAAVR